MARWHDGDSSACWRSTGPRAFEQRVRGRYCPRARSLTRGSTALSARSEPPTLVPRPRCQERRARRPPRKVPGGPKIRSTIAPAVSHISTRWRQRARHRRGRRYEIYLLARGQRSQATHSPSIELSKSRASVMRNERVRRNGILRLGGFDPTPSASRDPARWPAADQAASIGCAGSIGPTCWRPTRGAAGTGRRRPGRSRVYRVIVLDVNAVNTLTSAYAAALDRRGAAAWPS